MTKRRAVSEIIASLVLLAVTIVGGLLVFSLVTSNESIPGFGDSIEEAGNRGTSVKVIGYDTRDGDGLSSISGFDNTFDGILTTGSEYIVVKIRNSSVGTLTIHEVFVNEASHEWDSDSIGNTLVSGSVPSAGEFSMISDLDAVQFSTPELLSGRDARLIIALSSSITNNIELTQGIRIDITASDFDPARFIIPAGSAR